jgi:hypothetical protein
MEITIYTLDKIPTIIITDESDTIDFILIKYSDITGIDIDKARLLYKGKYLDKTKTIGFYGVKNDEHMHVIVK